ncbi:isoleucine--tRNA ligase [Jatrophihabitans telluris]|uniref:Isoleucine--tRNA ligase n=1 Tax=Jatrophihabitans telluris TaxID=2038343 RepID=A0ABY4QW12_9ACTN|nr:isoleucine--tRNA ligase [Jatrophihabitans telluris]UQX87180.1 isoleucine--tRNA ligase [Jatrophihabitans telluris]
MTSYRPDQTSAETAPPAYRALPAHVDLAATDHEVIEFWRRADVFRRSLAQTEGGPRYTFYEGPPTANGTPGTHHIEARAFKDLFPRFKTMKGYHVPRMAGWDCHGLPVELAVEKQLGFTGKPDIERFGIAEFNAACRTEVQRNVDQFLAMSERMGYWADYDNAYWTMNASYIESVWWALKQIFDQGLLVEDHRVAPYCPRCGTGLSDHEVAQGYETVVDPSVYVTFPLTSGPYAGEASLLVWTTTPWTLVSNTAVAVNPEVTYLVVRTVGGEREPAQTLVVAAPLVDKALNGAEYSELARLPGRDLERWTYQRPFEFVPIGDAENPAHYVVLADYVTTEDGSGLVHQAPAFGADDLATCRTYGLPVVNPVGKDGHFLADVPVVGGVFFKDADAELVRLLRDAGLLLRHVNYEHAYPHCWRCHTPLMYYALPSFYIRTTARKDELLRENERTNWYPETIKHGRYGDWLDNNIDWALSRDRYWGTPLPIWRNDADPTHLVCVGSLAELSALTGQDLSELDPHRPFVDAPTFTLPDVAGTFHRVPQVIDGWFDSGSMPFAQFGAPHRNAELAKAAYPADFISEAIDQTRGWFYTLMVVGTLVFDQSSYRNVVCLGHILAEDGRKMSKHLGNILEPISLMDQHGADAVRWFMLAGGSPWSARRVGHKNLEEIASKVLRTYWSIASFQSLYARANDWTPGTAHGLEPTALDRWATNETHRVALEVDDALEAYDPARAGRALAGLIDDLSNWYVRRSRRRFWDGDPAALQTLHDCLDVLTRLLAPFVPFVTERVWGALFAQSTGVESVHLAPWPERSVSVDSELSEQVALVRRIVELGRAARAESKVKTRQPLARALVSAPGWDRIPDPLKAEVTDELNVLELAALADAEDLVDVSVKPNFRALGKRFGSGTKDVATAISAGDPTALAHAVRQGGSATVTVGGEEIRVGSDELIVTEAPRSGWAVTSEGAETVALDLELTGELRRLGLLRDVIRLVQEARKNAGFEVTDRIQLRWRVGGSPDPAEAIRHHATELATEVLATDIVEGAVDTSPDRNIAGNSDDAIASAPTSDADWFSGHDEEMGLHFWIRRS